MLCKYKKIENTQKPGGSSCLMVKAMDCEIVVSEFKLQSRYYIHFRKFPFGNVWVLLISRLWVENYPYWLAQEVECSHMIREIWAQSQVTSYQRLKKWYLIPPCLTLSNTRYASRVKWGNPGKGVEPSLTLRCSIYWKGDLLVALDYGRPWLRSPTLHTYSSSRRMTLALNNL